MAACRCSVTDTHGYKSCKALSRDSRVQRNELDCMQCHEWHWKEWRCMWRSRLRRDSLLNEYQSPFAISQLADFFSLHSVAGSKLAFAALLHNLSTPNSYQLASSDHTLRIISSLSASLQCQAPHIPLRFISPSLKSDSAFTPILQPNFSIVQKTIEELTDVPEQPSQNPICK